MKKIPIGIVHGRFQPLHSGHLKYILAGLARCDFLYIGVCTPKLCTKEEAEKTGFPCLPEQNPLSFIERKKMIVEALKEKNIPNKKYKIIKFPSDYKNIEKYIPKNTTFFMTAWNDEGENKVKALRRLGLKVSVLSSIKKEKGEKSGTEIRKIFARAVT